MAIKEIQIVYVNDLDPTDVIDHPDQGFTAYLAAISDSTAADTTWIWTGTSAIPIEQEYQDESAVDAGDGESAASMVSLSSVSEGQVTINDGSETVTFTLATGSAIDGSQTDAAIVLGADDNGNLVTIDNTTTTSVTGSNSSVDAVLLTTTDVVKNPRTTVDWFGSKAVQLTDDTAGTETTFTIAETEHENVYNLSSSATGSVTTTLNNVDSVYYDGNEGSFFNLQRVEYSATDSSAHVTEGTIWNDIYHLDVKTDVEGDSVEVANQWTHDTVTGDFYLTATHTPSGGSASTPYTVASLHFELDANDNAFYELTYAEGGTASIDSGAGNYDPSKILVTHLYDFDAVEAFGNTEGTMARFEMPTTDVITGDNLAAISVDTVTSITTVDISSAAKIEGFEAATDVVKLNHTLNHVNWVAGATEVTDGTYSILRGTLTGDTFTVTDTEPQYSLVVYDSDNADTTFTTSAVLVDSTDVAPSLVFVRSAADSGTDDWVFASSEEDNTSTGDGNDFVSGSSGADVIIAGGGADIVRGGVGNDTIAGGVATFGHDQATTDVHDTSSDYEETAHVGIMEYEIGINDILYGEQGNDMLFGGNGNDVLNGGNSVDGGHNYLDGGEGEDFADYSDIPTNLYVTVDLFKASHQQDTINDASGEVFARDHIVNIEGVNGSSGADDIKGNGYNNIIGANDGGDTISGGRGVDMIDGGAGDDTIHGGMGNDFLMGGAGSDTLIGGIGRDAFAYSTDDLADIAAHSSKDIIKDYNKWTDKIVVEGATEGGSKLFVKADGSLVYDASGDSNWDGTNFTDTSSDDVVLAELANYSGSGVEDYSEYLHTYTDIF